MVLLYLKQSTVPTFSKIGQPSSTNDFYKQFYKCPFRVYVFLSRITNSLAQFKNNSVSVVQCTLDIKNSLVKPLWQPEIDFLLGLLLVQMYCCKLCFGSVPKIQQTHCEESTERVLSLEICKYILVQLIGFSLQLVEVGGRSTQVIVLTISPLLHSEITAHRSNICSVVTDSTILHLFGCVLLESVQLLFTHQKNITQFNYHLETEANLLYIYIN